MILYFLKPIFADVSSLFVSVTKYDLFLFPSSSWPGPGSLVIEQIWKKKHSDLRPLPPKMQW